jgi:hypothetical protein
MIDELWVDTFTWELRKSSKIPKTPTALLGVCMLSAIMPSVFNFLLSQSFAAHNLIFVLFYVFVCFVSLCVLFVCQCVLYYCHRVATQLQLTNIYHHITSHRIISYIISHHIYIISSYHITSYIYHIIYHITSYHISYHHITSYHISYHISYRII